VTGVSFSPIRKRPLQLGGRRSFVWVGEIAEADYTSLGHSFAYIDKQGKGDLVRHDS
jgi:hypothetical protein